MGKIGSKNIVQKTNVYSIKKNMVKKNIDKAILYLAFAFSLIALLRSFRGI